MSVGSTCRSSCDHAMRIKDKLFNSALVEFLVALGSLFQGNDAGVDRPGDLHLVVQDRIHQLAVVVHDRALTGKEGERLGPCDANIRTGLRRIALAFGGSSWCLD